MKSILRFAKPNPLLIILSGSSYEDSESRKNPELGQFFFVLSFAGASGGDALRSRVPTWPGRWPPGS